MRSPSPMDRVAGKTAIVTGAARGIGRACARLLAQEGAFVYLTDRDTEPGEAAAADVVAEGGEATFVAQDVSQEEDWERLVERVQAERGGVDILVNNAGLYVIEALEESTVDCFEKIFATNVRGVFLGMKHVGSMMAGRESGSIVNISSMDAFAGAAGFAIYGGSKGAITTMTRDVAIELAERRVRVNSVHPGYIHTRMAAYGAAKEGRSIEALGDDFPLGHIGEPIDVAYGVLYLASDEARWVTGTQLRIDGGILAQ